MSKAEPILKIEPENELRFRGPFKEPVSVLMKLTNITEKKVSFKVKTTAPKRYCVKPTTGTIEPKAVINIQVTLQPFDPNDPNEKGKHKFQVLSVYAPVGDFNIDTLWKEVSQDSIHDWKLKCVLDIPEDGLTNAAPSATLTNSSDVTSSAPVSTTSIGAKGDDKSSKDSYTQKISSLEWELREATEEINRLREEISLMTKENIQLKEEGIRLRRVAVSGSGNETGFKAEEPPVHRPVGHDSNASPLATPNLMYILIAILLGIILGKILF